MKLKPNTDYHIMATDLLNAGIGDKGRLEFILECIEKNKPLYNTDERYLIQKYETFEKKLETLSGKKKTKKIISDDTLDEIVDKALSKPERDSEIIPPKKRKSFFGRLFRK